MKHHVLFDIPIYRESEQAYYNCLQKKQRVECDRLASSLSKLNVQIEANDIPPLNPLKISWNYNRIIGWIVFYSQGTTIKADLWIIRHQRLSHSLVKKIFDYKGKMQDVAIVTYKDNPEIRKDIVTFLSTLRLPENLKGCYIDSDLFLRNLQYMDIKSLVDSLSNK
jgi:hypothetical protein